MRLQSTFKHFFFHGEDGIRAIGVTGVQTCALPISTRGARLERLAHGHVRFGPRVAVALIPKRRRAVERSEERRVGKECRSRWSLAHCKNMVQSFNETDGCKA